MKKFVLAGLFCFMVLLFPEKTYAIGPFTAHPGNPIHIQSDYPNWKESTAYQQFVVFEDGIFKMWYTSINGDYESNHIGSKIGYATSTDGINWTGQKVLDSGEYTNVHSPSIITYGLIKYLFFQVNNDGGKIIRAEISSENEIILSTLKVVFTANYQKELYIDDPTVEVIQNDIYLLFTNNNGIAWNINMAYFNDDSFERCTTNPILTVTNASAPTLNEIGNSVYLTYHKDGQIFEVHTIRPISCSSIWSDPVIIADYESFYPSITTNNNRLYLFTNTLNPISINLWTAPLEITAPLRPIIIVPGMFASWNKDAILHNTTVNASEWDINPVVHEYDGIIKTLENIGYVKNTNLFLFSYDWRKSVTSSAQDLNTFISSLPQDSSYDLVGHSLGGLVIRSYLNTFGSSKINQAVTVGTPHLGTPKAYKAVQGGGSDTDDPLFWFTQKIILQLNKTGIMTDKQVMNKRFPVLQELLPTYDYLKNSKGASLPTTGLKIQNTILPTLTHHLENIKSVGSESTETTYGYVVKNRSTLDVLLDLYPDGRPTEAILAPGDGVVPAVSALWGTSPIKLPFQHGPLIYTKGAIKSILSQLNINLSDDKIVEGTGTNFSPSIIFMLLSPANMEINDGVTSYEEKKGIIHIQSPGQNPYTITLTATGTGPYKLMAGYFASGVDNWTEVTGYMGEPGQIITHSFVISGWPLFDSDNPIRLLDNCISSIQVINNQIQNKHIQKALVEAEKAKKAFTRNKMQEFKSQWFSLNASLLKSISDTTARNITPNILRVVDTNEYVYAKLMLKNDKTNMVKQLTQEERLLKQAVKGVEDYLAILKRKGYNVNEGGVVLAYMSDKLKQISFLPKEQMSLKEIQLNTVFQLVKVIKFFVKKP